MPAPVEQNNPEERLTAEFFREYPDYAFCRTLAQNVKSSIVTYPNALALLARKVRAAEENRLEITEKLEVRSILTAKGNVRLRDLSLAQAMQLEDEGLQQVLEFYFKHPYAHGRTLRLRVLPRPVRTFFLGVLVGHAKRRGLRLDYASYFALLKML